MPALPFVDSLDATSLRPSDATSVRLVHADVLPRHRLLPQPQGFEGFGTVVVVVEARDLAVTKGHDLRHTKLHSDAALPTRATVGDQAYDASVGRGQDFFDIKLVVVS